MTGGLLCRDLMKDPTGICISPLQPIPFLTVVMTLWLVLTAPSNSGNTCWLVVHPLSEKKSRITPMWVIRLASK